MHRTITLIALIAFLAAAPAGSGQAPPAAPNALAAKIIQARAVNTALMKNYTWNCRTELIQNDKTLDVRIEQVQVGADGNLQRTVLNNDTFSHPKGLLPTRRLASRLAEGIEDGDVQNRLKEFRALLDQYLHPTATKIGDFISKAAVENVTDANGTPRLRLQGSDVVVPGDWVAIWADTTTHKLCKVDITTSFQGKPANLTATFKTLASGLTIMNFAEVELPEKNVTLQLHNYDFEALSN